MARPGEVDAGGDRLRFVQVTGPAMDIRQETIDDVWKKATDYESAKAFSAIGLWFGLELMERLGVPVHLCAGSPRNIKLTAPEDLTLADFYLSGLPRVGHGYDAHRLVPDRKLILGGVEIPYEKGLLGHSDADVLVHAVIDALLGAAALGDIGGHFPDSDPQYKGVFSIRLLEETARILKDAGFAPRNIDATLIAQRPKLAAYIPRMRENIAAAVGLDTACVSVKATTTEGMGFEGAGEGISAHAVALIVQANA